MVLSFDRSDSFSFDKPANVPCPHLRATDRCAIHDSLGPLGLSGCVRYDCYGAGQRVTQELFAGRSWRSQPELEQAMFGAFRVMKQVHELLLLLHEAGRLELSPARAERREQLLRRLEPSEGWTAERALSFDAARCHDEVHEFLRTLRDCVSPPFRKRHRRLPLVTG